MKIKQMIKFPWFATTLLGIMATGCTCIKSEHIPGSRVELTDEVLPECSVWSLDDECIFQVYRVHSNQLAMAIMDWDEDQEEFTVETTSIVLSELDDQWFLSFVCPDGDDDLYSIYRIARPLPDTNRPPETLLIHAFDVEKIEEHIADGFFDASVNDNEITFDGSKEALDSYLSGYGDTIYSLEATRILKRVSCFE